jgi:membrane protease subunit HflC
MAKIKSFGVIIFVVVSLIVFSFFFVIEEGQGAVLLRLGEMSKASDGKVVVYKPGIHFKLPIVNNIKKFDMRTQVLIADPFMVLTSQQTFLSIDYFVEWRIMNLPQFYTSMAGSYLRAERLLEQKINDAVRAEIGKRTSNEVISSERENTMKQIIARANAVVEPNYGVKLIDVRLQSIQLPPKIMTSVFNRMASERKQFAEFNRAEGTKTAEGIRALADQSSVIIKAQARANAAKVKAIGDQKAAEIYAASYGKDKEFFTFLKSLQAYQLAFSTHQGAIVMRPDSQFFKYFNASRPRGKKSGGG